MAWARCLRCSCCGAFAACRSTWPTSLRYCAFAPPHAAAVATAIYSGIFNLGIGGGSAVGGAVSTAFGMGSVCFAGALIGAAAVAIACVFLIPVMRRTKPAE